MEYLKRLTLSRDYFTGREGSFSKGTHEWRKNNKRQNIAR